MTAELLRDRDIERRTVPREEVATHAGVLLAGRPDFPFSEVRPFSPDETSPLFNVPTGEALKEQMFLQAAQRLATERQRLVV